MKKSHLKSLIMMFFGVVLTAMAISIFLLPNKIVCGGVSGIATILYHSFSLPPGLSFAVINIVLLLIGIKILGREFIVKTLLGAGLLSLFVQLFSYLPPLTENVLLASIFGGTLYGFGIGIALAAGASTGGTDILGRLLQYKFPVLPIGKALLIVDGTVILTSFLVFRQNDLALLGILSLFVETYAIDWLIKKLNISRLAFVITDRGDEISQQLISTSPRGVTMIDVLGAYSKEPKSLLLCAIKENEASAFQQKINAIDPDAFVIFAQSQQILGKGFVVYR